VPPPAPEQGEVAALNHEGAGIVRAGKSVFIPGALPGEQVRFQRRRHHRRHDDGELLAVLAPSAARVEPRCAHFRVCGGCALQHLAPEAQRELKQRELADSLERVGRVAPRRWLAPIADAPWGYRRRARLGVKYVERKGRVVVGFRERDSNLIAALERCEVLASPVGALIAPLAELITALSVRERLPQIEVAVADGGVALVLRVLEPPSIEDIERLREFERAHTVRLYLQASGIESVRALTEPAPALHYGLPEAGLELEFQPTDFIQINGAVNRLLVAAAAELLELTPQARVLDLYCGLGNFTLSLARRARSVLGVEGDAGLIERARRNALRNGISNAEFVRVDLSGALAGSPWLAQPHSHVLLDPPRIGARELLPEIARLAPQRLLYVSCHPGTLARDLGLLVHEYGFDLLAAGVVDMFPHTAHVESLALLAPRA
jgi:23S rRNA (uracil1939-C5)-methyltransferase